MASYGQFIKFDGRGFADPRLYERTMLDLTYSVSRTRTGMWVLYEVKNSGFELVVVPAATIYEVEANPGNKHPARVKDSRTVCALPAKSSLEFLPGLYDAKKGVFVDGDPFFRAADTYVHELFHKARIMQGLYCKDATDDGYEDIEEFFAILVANVHASEVGGNSRLRGSHAPLFEPLKLTNSYDFWMRYDQRLSKLAGQMEKFCKRIAEIKCSFNPYREYYKHISQARDTPGSPGMTPYPGHGNETPLAPSPDRAR